MNKVAMNEQQAKLRKKLRLYRSAKFGSMFLAVISIAVAVLMAVTREAENESFGPMYAAAFFWPAVAYICHLKMEIISYEIRDQDD